MTDTAGETATTTGAGTGTGTGSGTGPVELLVCATCRLGQPKDAEAPLPGAVLAERLAAAAPGSLRVTPVACFSNCDGGCTIALRGPGRWTYVYGALDPDAHLGAILEGAAKYAESADGRVPWRERPEHFRRNCVARIPPPDALTPDTPAVETPHG
jgi:predicted metal-binding protein